MTKTTGFVLSEELIKKVALLGLERGLNNSEYISQLIEEDWNRHLGKKPFAEKMLEELNKNGK